MFAEDHDVCVEESICSKRLQDVIYERDTLSDRSHTLNDIEVRFQKADNELRAVKFEKDALVEKVSVLQSGLREAPEVRDSLQVISEDCAVPPEKTKRNSQLDCLSSLDVTCVGMALTILNAIPKMGKLETGELNPFQENLHRR